MEGWRSGWVKVEDQVEERWDGGGGEIEVILRSSSRSLASKHAWTDQGVSGFVILGQPPLSVSILH